jgi:drug/metabolite transporter (DMT)-like permease
MFHPENLALFFGLAAALTWGTGDFCGGMATKKGSVYTVVLISHLIGGCCVTLIALLVREPFPPIGTMIWGALAGFAGMLGVLGLYSGLAKSQMGVIAPLTAVLTAIIPILFSFFTEGLPAAIQIVGFAVALAAVWLLAGSNGKMRLAPVELGYAALAGMGFAFFFIFIDQASETAVYWPLTAARTTSVLCITIFVSVRGLWERPSREQMPMIVGAGIADVLGNAFFSLATRYGRLDLAAILASLYPVSTVLLAQLILHERLHRPQWIGAVLALLAVILITL